MTERQIELNVLQFLNFQPGCFAFKVQTKASFDPRRKRFLSLPKGVVPGSPDIICCYHGIFIAIEVKTAKGRQSEAQKEFERIVKSRAKGHYFVVRSIEDAAYVLEFVREFGIIS